jgi:hypothetical protein
MALSLIMNPTPQFEVCGSAFSAFREGPNVMNFQGVA